MHVKRFEMSQCTYEFAQDRGKRKPFWNHQWIIITTDIKYQ